VSTTSEPSPAAPSGQQHEIAAGDYTAIVVEVGAGLRQLSLASRDIVDGYAEAEICSGGRGQLLLPWPNRVLDGRYEFADQSRQLALTEPAKHNAIHGLTRWAAWALLDHSGDQVVLGHRLHPQPGYPHILDLTVAYTLDARAGLAVTLDATNVGDRAAPFAAGAHPYLTAGTATVDSCALHMPADTWLETDDRGIPTSRHEVAGSAYDFRSPGPIGQVMLDTPMTDLSRDDDGRARVTLSTPDGSAATTLWCDESFGWLQVFPGDTLPQDRRRQGVAVEPMTAPPNAFATGEDLVVLEPGASWSASWGITGRRS
jgi:aldose 1-epimerase